MLEEILGFMAQALGGLSMHSVAESKLIQLVHLRA